MQTTLSPSGFALVRKVAFGLLCLFVGLIALLGRSYFIGILAIIGGISVLMPGSGTLKLDEQGFHYRVLGRRFDIEWAKVQAFGIVKTKYMGFITIRKRVGWTLHKDPNRSLIAKAASAFTSYDGALPDNYGKKPQELAALLEAWRQGALTLTSNTEAQIS